MKKTYIYKDFVQVVIIQKPSNIVIPPLYNSLGSTEEEKKLSALARARRNIKRLGYANVGYGGCTLITQTFDRDCDLKEAWRCNTLFFQRFRKYDRQLRYISVLELQKSGRPHFHSLVFSDFVYKKAYHERSTRFLAKIWGEGFLDAVRTDSSLKLISYLSKYLTKQDLPKGVKRFSVSRNAFKPKVISTLHLTEKDWDDTLQRLGQPEWEAPVSPILGRVIGYIKQRKKKYE